MSEQKQPIHNLDELNEQFNKQHGLEELNEEFLQTLNKKSKKRTDVRKVRLLALLALLAVVIIITINIKSRLRNRQNVKTHSTVSNEEEYQDQYEKVNIDTPFIGINDVIAISDEFAYVGLVNSAGSNSLLVIKIYDKETEDVFYESEKIHPGSILHTAKLDTPVNNIDSTALSYTIYDLEGTKQGEYQTDIIFENQSDKGGDK